MASGTVLVTGASSGIGEAAAIHLRSLGFDVVAGARRDEDLERLAASGLRTRRLDVTDAEHVDALRRDLGAGELFGLVNNAGIAVSAPLEFLPIEQLRRQLEVNLIGQVAVTQALLPALRRSRGRIVNVSSLGGRVALPLASAYSASKFALEAVSDSLRREVRQFGIEVVVVEPGGVKTRIWGKGEALADEMLARMPPDAERLYGGIISTLRRESKRIDTKTGMGPNVVAEAIGTALTAERPRTRHLLGRDARIIFGLSRILPTRRMDAVVGRLLG